MWLIVLLHYFIADYMSLKRTLKTVSIDEKFRFIKEVEKAVCCSGKYNLLFKKISKQLLLQPECQAG